MYFVRTPVRSKNKQLLTFQNQRMECFLSSFIIILIAKNVRLLTVYIITLALKTLMKKMKRKIQKYKSDNNNKDKNRQ